MAKKKRSGWGGARPGAGRKPKGERAGVPHLKRARLVAGRPIHVTVRMRADVWNLTTRRCLPVVEAAFSAGAERFGFELVQYSVQPDHIHLLVEAANQRALGRGMKGIGVRLSRGLNKLMEREGTVLDDRYEPRVLATPAEEASVRRSLKGDKCPPNQSPLCAA
jgi:REP-associated tyrosine transposase